MIDIVIIKNPIVSDRIVFTSIPIPFKILLLLKKLKSQDMKNLLLVFLLIDLYYQVSSNDNTGLIGYDCYNHPINLTTISLVTLPDCSVPPKLILKENIEILMVQVEEIKEINLQSCLVVATHLVTRCGKMTDSIQKAGLKNEILHLSRDECNTLINDKKFTFKKFGNEQLITLKNNYGDSSFTSHGSVNSEGSCNPGSEIIIDGQTYSRALIQTTLRFQFSPLKANLDNENGIITLENGESLKYSDEQAFSPNLGNLYWKVKEPQCDDKDYIIIYEGLSTRVTTNRSGIEEVNYVMQHQDYDFSLTRTAKTTYICRHLSYYSEHHNLFIIEKSKLYLFPASQKLTSKNVNIMNYMNSKMVYVAKHTQMQFEKLVETLGHDRCLTEQRVLKNRLSIASIDPLEFAYQYGGPGHTAKLAGETVVLAKCMAVPVNLNLEFSGQCFQEVPVTMDGISYFMAPKTRVLKQIGTPISCTDFISTKFHVNGKWFSYTANGFLQVSDPNVLQIKPFNFEYSAMNGLASSGLYSPKIIQSVQKTIMMAQEQNTISKRITSSLVTGQNDLPKDTSIITLISEDDKRKIKGFFESTYDSALVYGSMFGFIMLIFTIYKAVIQFFSAFINYNAVSKEYNPIVACFTCLWDNLTHHILEGRVPKLNRFKRKPADNKNIELVERPIAAFSNMNPV